jgi:hypothetical protein
MKFAIRIVTVLAAVVVVACSGASTSSPQPTVVELPSAAPATPTASSTPVATPTAVHVATPSAAPTSFTSPVYGYSLTVPARWTVIEASEAWGGGDEASSHDVPQADQFVSPGPSSAWMLAAPTDEDLQGYVDERITANAAGHSSTCPPTPEIQDPIDVGDEPGMLLGYNCGILINLAVAVHDGVGYLFGMRDPSVHAATDATDRATFEALLGSVSFPAGAFHSDVYGYTVGSPAWSGTPAATAWDGTGALGDSDPAVDSLVGPSMRGFAYGISTTSTLEEFAQASRIANAEAHPCPVEPDSTTSMTVGGAPALLDTLDCGVFVLTAYVLHDGKATVFGSYGPKSSEATMREGFGVLLESLSFDD